MPSCQKCHSPRALPGPDICMPCATTLRADTGSEFLRDLAAYWDRRRSENRRRDWT